MFPSTPPRVGRGRRNDMLGTHVHNAVTELREGRIGQRFSEEVRGVVGGLYVGHDDATLFDTFTYKEVSAGDMFHAAEMFWVIGDVYGALIIYVDDHGSHFPRTELFENVGNV